MRANIEVERLFAAELLEDWDWLLKGPHALLAMNNFGDMFLRDGKGKIHMLELSTGSLKEIANSQSEFQGLVAIKENQKAWFLLDLLTELERSGMALAPGQCFSLKKPLALGGACEKSNIEVAPISVYVSMMGQIHRQLKDLPPETRVAGCKID